MSSLTYVSSATVPLSAEELRALLAKSRSNNERDGITGMLLYKDGNFMQVLEGPREVVMSVQKRIYGDPCHHGLLVLLQRDVKERSFGSWSIAFSRSEFRNRAGTSRATMIF
jgi:hypothetical protein